MNCFDCGKEGADHHGVEAWTLDGFRRQVSTCSEHSKCAVCNEVLEINPISDRAECFSHPTKR